MTETLTPQRCPTKPEPPRCPAPRKVTVADVLERAADRVERKGLWQASRDGNTRGECIITAIAAEAELPDDYTDADLDAICVRLGFDDANTAARWNDVGTRTAAQVVARLRAAASSARTKEEA